MEVEPGINFEKLSNMTKGYSGDDLTNVCRDAAMNGMRRKIAGKTPDQIRSVTLPCKIRLPGRRNASV